MGYSCGSGAAPTWLHLPRGVALAGNDFPLASVDGSSIARHRHRHRAFARSAAARSSAHVVQTDARLGRCSVIAWPTIDPWCWCNRGRQPPAAPSTTRAQSAGPLRS
jgi:hypothetical protein